MKQRCWSAWYRLRNLRRLVLRGNNLKRLPRLLARLPALQALDLSYNASLEVSHARPAYQPAETFHSGASQILFWRCGWRADGGLRTCAGAQERE